MTRPVTQNVFLLSNFPQTWIAELLVDNFAPPSPTSPEAELTPCQLPRGRIKKRNAAPVRDHLQPQENLSKPRKKSLSVMAVSSTLALSLLLTACGGGSTASSSEADAGTPKSGGTLVYATGDSEPTCLDAVSPGNVAQALVSTQYLESLFFQDDNGDIQPWLAKSWKWSKDRLSLDVTLRDDVNFTDGTPLNADTVIENVKYIKDPKTLSSTAILALEKVKSVEKINEQTARIHLSSPDNALLEHFAQVWVPIQSQTALKRGVEKNCLSPVGTGPFKVESWTKQQEVVLVRNEDYNTAPPGSEHEGPAYLEKIRWRFLPDNSARYAALQSGEVDVIDVLQPQDEVAAESDPTIDSVVKSRPGQVVNLALNSRKEPFKDVKVREAFVRAVDVDAALNSVFLGKVPRSNSFLSTITKYNVQQPEAFSTDVAKANQLLDEAGWTERDSEGFRTKNGRRLSVNALQTSYVLVPVAMLEQFQASAKEVGIELNISQEETASFSARRNAWDYDVLPNYYTKNSPAVLNLTHTLKNIGANGTGYHSNSSGITGAAAEEYDKILAEASTTPDDKQRGELYEQAQILMAKQYPNLPISDQQTRLGYRSDVEGIKLISPLSMPQFHDAWLNR